MNNKQIDFNKIINIWASFLKSRVLFIPTLGPIYCPQEHVKGILCAVLNNQDNKFLPFDKDKRWFKTKNEKIIIEAIKYNKKEIYITIEDRLNKKNKIFYFSNQFPTKLNIEEAERIINQRAKSNYSTIFYCFKKPKLKNKSISQIIFLKKINKKDKMNKKQKNISVFNQLPKIVQNTFKKLGAEADLNNFSFLWQKIISKKKKFKPIFCAVSENKIVGAIGPMDFGKDINGKKFLFPPNFGVLKKFRGKGMGDNLWKEAMNYCYKKGAFYTLVQNTENSRAAKFYERNGLEKAKNIYSIKI